MTMDGGRAVTVLSGFLGSGKTTLLRRYLRERGGAGIAVIINEYGEVGVDHHLLRIVKDQPVLLKGGCVCCTKREDLVRTLRELLDLEQSGALAPLRQVVIETSGMADPVPILFTLATDPVLKHHFAPATVVVTLDALNAGAQIERQPEVRKQIVAADLVVVTKADLASADALTRHRTSVRQINPAVKVAVSRFGDGFDQLVPAAGTGRMDALRRGHDLGGNSTHVEVRSMAVGFSAPLAWPAFGVWLGMLLEAHGPDMLRIKGLLDVGESGPVAMNTAQHVVHPPEHLMAWPAGAWPADVHRSYLVFITRGIDPAGIAASLETFQRAGGRPDLSLIGLA